MSSARQFPGAAPEPAPGAVPLDARVGRLRAEAAHVQAVGERQVPRRRSRPRARWAPTVFLLLVDVATFVVAMVVTGAVSPKTLAELVLLLALFHGADLYRSRLSLSVLDDAPAIVGRSLIAGAGAMVLGGINDGIAGTARLWTALAFGGLCLATRAVAYSLIRAARRRHLLDRRTLVLGAGTVAGFLSGNLLTHPSYGLRPVGLVDDDPLLGEDERPVPLLSGYDDLPRVLVEQAVDVVIVTFGSIREPSVVGLVRACDRLSCEILFVPRLYELHSVTKDTEVLWGVPLVRLRRAAFRTPAWAAKRVMDVVIASLALLFLAPVLGLCALASRLETGSVLFRQTRIGLDGRPFPVLKFCSLRPASESEASTTWNIGGDTRVGPVGRFLRRSSLDELPQLWNVVRGDMSLVGPRPERPYFVGQFTTQISWYTARHRVPAGLTGWAQIHGLRGNTSIADRARFDNFYIENWSMWGDIKILVRTVGQVFRGGGR